MYNLPKPQMSYFRRYVRCIQVGDPLFKRNLANIFPVLQSAGNTYDTHAQTSSLFTLAKINPTTYSPVSEVQLKDIYSEQLAKKKRPGRVTYDALILSAKGRCPYCSHNYPKTIDHYLPKAEFPEFSIFPYNLVPCCWDCNHSKSTKLASVITDQYIHPYYDNVPSTSWLRADVLFPLNSPTIIFFTFDKQGIIDPNMLSRIEKQFADLEIGKLYSIQASNELSGIEFNLQQIFDAGGAEQVKDYLSDLSHSWNEEKLNCWQSAFYDCLASSVQFCEMKWTL